MPLGALLGFHFKLGAAGLWWGLLIALTIAAVVLVFCWQSACRSIVNNPSKIVKVSH
jgi:MATE family multidrug resistance protein